MKNITKIAIVILLVVVVGGVITLKQRQNNTNQKAITSDKENLALEGSSRPLPRLLDLGAGKCIPCKMMAPILDELKEEYTGQFDVVFIDVWENPDESQKYGIKLIPTQIFFDALGAELYRHEGFFSKEDYIGPNKLDHALKCKLEGPHAKKTFFSNIQVQGCSGGNQRSKDHIRDCRRV